MNYNNYYYFFAARGPLTAVASPVAEHRLRMRRAQPLRGTWDLPGLGHEPVSPASAGDSQPLRHQGSPWSCILIPISLITCKKGHLVMASGRLYSL